MTARTPQPDPPQLGVFGRQATSGSTVSAVILGTFRMHRIRSGSWEADCVCSGAVRRERFQIGGDAYPGSGCLFSSVFSVTDTSAL